jgi:hypothetical protein
MDCSNWPDEERRYYEEGNEQLNFFKTQNLTTLPMRATEFPQKIEGICRKKRK